MAAPWPARGTNPWDVVLRAYIDDPERFATMLAAAGGGGGGSGAVAWGFISGDITSQADLQAALGAKVDESATLAGITLDHNITAPALADALGVTSTTQKGTARFATNPEGIAGTDDATIITPETLAAVVRPIIVAVAPWWPIRWVAGSGWPARTTIPQWYRDLGGHADYLADDPTLTAGSVTLPTDRIIGDHLDVLTVLLAP